ncbi:hypothetical protein HAP48_0034835 [Bradyrhizobium septentrionale]|uniref:Uncharacterized protein n=1 Tax=Bradyrhizobium septentrionale TaxID=1404411 RepID=A0A973VZQ7_9BRAD|nr:hypothetical protein [Bradyrhizobium septentrionale]UGY13712.1 hypothetical protein HAP48_0034835 [Bradyrhizobium septentrionale]
MPAKFPDIPPDVARKFLNDMAAYFSASTELQRDEIAARWRHILLDYMPAKTTLRLNDVKELFRKMRDEG